MFGLSKKSLGCWILANSMVLSVLAYGQAPLTEQNIPPVTNKTERPDKPKQSPTQQQNVSVNFPSTVNVTIGGKLEIETANHQTQENKEPREKPEWWLAFWTFILVCVTSALAYYTKSLWGATSKLVQGAESTATQQLRAYVYVEEDSTFLSQCFRNGQEVGVNINLLVKNVGKTPAFKFNYWINAGVFHNPHRGEFPPREFNNRNAYLPPGVEKKICIQWVDIPWRLATLNSNAGGHDANWLYVWGEVSYRDAFKEDRFVKFRMMRERQSDATVIDCEEGNDAN